jgi:endonuclease YncB( thermonuclease family)
MRFVFALCLALIPAMPAGAETLTGRARVVDGDTLELNGERLRLMGIDAPEKRQTCERDDGRTWKCGKWVSKELADLLAASTIKCSGDQRDDYDRLLVKCYLEKTDLSALLVSRGMALAYREYSIDYVNDEKGASFQGIGIWSGSFQRPKSFRDANKLDREAASQIEASAPCPIKGNISESEKIFHVPGQRDYAATLINEANGERWFCSEAEAIAAGWRRARR